MQGGYSQGGGFNAIQGGGPPGASSMQGGAQALGMGGGRMQAISGPQVFRAASGSRPGTESNKMHLFQKTLRDMITGMRQASDSPRLVRTPLQRARLAAGSELFRLIPQHKNPSEQSRYIQKCLQDIRDEVRVGQRLVELERGRSGLIFALFEGLTRASCFR